MKTVRFRQRRPINDERFTLYFLRIRQIIPKINAMATAIQSICHIADEYMSAGSSDESPISRERTIAEANITVSVRRIFRIVGLFYRHALSLDQPAGSTHGSKYNHFRNVWEALFHHVAYESVVGYVA